MEPSAIHGVGISYRCEFAPFEKVLAREVDCVEVLFEETFVPGVDGLEALTWDVPKIAHALSFSPARADFVIDDVAQTQLARAREHGVGLISDHLSFSSVGEFRVQNFFSCDFTVAEAERVGGNLRALRKLAGMQVAVENPALFMMPADAELQEVDFVNRVLAAGDCGMLLDVNNLYINAVNHGFDPYAFIDRLDRERVAYLHVAGFGRHRGFLVDSHGSDVADEVWALLEHALRTTAASAVVLERDNRSATLAGLLRELGVIRDLWRRTRRTAPASTAPSAMGG